MANTAEAGKAPLCFVIGPIGKDASPERKHADLLLHTGIKEILEAKGFGYKVKRADEDTDPGMIGDRVISDLIHAELVVADLSDLNPNAFYELGIRHSTEKPTIHIARSGTPLPFDNVTHRTIFIDLTDWHSIQRGRAQLAGSARAIRDPEFQVSNPITQANASFKMRESADPRDRVIAQLQERVSLLEQRSAVVAKNLIGDDHVFLRYSPTDIKDLIEAGLKSGDAPELVAQNVTNIVKGDDPDAEIRLTSHRADLMEFRLSSKGRFVAGFAIPVSDAR
jgi:hypothetical protein